MGFLRLKFINTTREHRIIFPMGCVLIVLSLFVGYFNYTNLKSHTEESERNELLILSNQIKISIKELFAKYEEDLSFFASLKAIIDLNEDGKNLMREYSFAQRKSILGITRISAGGKILYTAPFDPNAIGKDVSGQKHNAEIIKTHKPTLSDVISVVQGLETIVLAYPVFKENKYNGCISILIPFTDITQRHLKGLEQRRKTFVTIFNEVGTVIFSEQKDWIGKNVSNIFSSIEKLNSLKGQKEFFYNGKTPEISSDGMQLINLNSVSLPSDTWTILLATDRANLFWSLKEHTLNNLAIFFLFILGNLLCVFSVYLSRKNKIDKIAEKDFIYTSVSQKMKLVYYDFNLNTEIIRFMGNTEHLLDENIDEMNVNDWWKIVDPRDRSKRKYFLASAYSNQVEIAEYKLFKDEKIIFVQDASIILEDAKTGELHQYGLIRDITKEKEWEHKQIIEKEKLEEYAKEKNRELIKAKLQLEKEIAQKKTAIEQIQKDKKFTDELIIKLSDAIISPLYSAYSASEYLLELDIFAENNESKFLKMVHFSVDKVTRRISKLIKSTEYKMNGVEVSLSEFNLHTDCLSNIVAEFSSLAKNQQVELNYTNYIQEPIIFSDANLLGEIIKEIVENGIMFAENGSVEVKLLKYDDAHFEINISDTGPGFPEGFTLNSFELFNQVQNEYYRSSKGLGLGLFIANSYAQELQIDIKLNSLENFGAEVRLIIPQKLTISKS